MASIISCSNPMAIAGTASAASTTCSSVASFCRQTHGFRAGVEFSAENRPESAPRTGFGGEHGGVFAAYLICSRWSVCERGHQQNTPLRSRQEVGGNGIIMIVTAGNGQGRHKRRTLQLSVQAKGGCGEFPVAGDRRFPKPRMTC